MRVADQVTFKARISSEVTHNRMASPETKDILIMRHTNLCIHELLLIYYHIRTQPTITTASAILTSIAT